MSLFLAAALDQQVENSVGGELVLDAVPIVTPNCDLVVPSLSFTVSSHLTLIAPSYVSLSTGVWGTYHFDRSSIVIGAINWHK